MKKFGLYSPDGNRYAVLMKGLIAMKITLILILFSTFNLLATGTYSQTARVSLKLHQTSVKQVLKEIERSSEFYFLYNNDLIDVERKVDILANNEQISSILDRLFESQEAKYAVYDKQIVISPTDMKLPPEARKIKGRVTDQTGASLPGVSVVITGTTNGTITDTDGNYSLTNIPENATLQFSFVGMKAQTIAVQGKQTIDVILEEDKLAIDEVIVIGYGTAKRQDYTGSVSSVKMENSMVSLAPNINALESLKGNVAGLSIGATNTAGGEPSMDIRGQNSIYGDNNPLIVLDGVIYLGSLSDINPNDIASYDILKDAVSAAAYGSRSANGIIPRCYCSSTVHIVYPYFHSVCSSSS